MSISKSAFMDKFRLYFKNHSEEIAMILYSMNPNAGNWAYLPQMLKKHDSSL